MANISEQVKKSNINNIIKKLKSNKVLTKQEVEAVEEYERSESAKTNGEAIIINSVQCAAFFDVTTMTLTNWSKMGFPKVATNTYDLKKCFDWWAENINKGNSKEEIDVRKRYWNAKAENEEIKVSIKKGLLIANEKIVSEFTERALDLKTSLRALKYRISGLVVGKNQDEIMQILGAEIDEMLRNFCRNGRYIALEENKTDKKEPAKTKKTAKNQIKKAVKDKKSTKTAKKGKK